MKTPGGWPWAAGLFEGEGTIYWDTKPKQWRLAVTMTDEDAVQRFHGVVQCGKVYGPYERRGNRKPVWTWISYDPLDVRAALDMLLPYLCGRRADKAQEALDHIDTLERQ